MLRKFKKQKLWFGSQEEAAFLMSLWRQQTKNTDFFLYTSFKEYGAGKRPPGNNKFV